MLDINLDQRNCICMWNTFHTVSHINIFSGARKGAWTKAETTNEFGRRPLFRIIQIRDNGVSQL